MGKIDFFTHYKDDENHVDITVHPDEATMVKERWEASKQAPFLVIRGQALKINITTQVEIV